MKSILQEASNIARAVNKAWQTAGRPAEFMVKVLCEGEKNFLGLSKHPAIISLTYKPQKQTEKQKQPPIKKYPYEEKKQLEQKLDVKPRGYWNQSLVNTITTWLKEIAIIMGIPSEFSYTIDNKRLTIAFAQPPLNGAADEPLLLSSISKLLLQALQKQHKRKFNGYSLMITTKKQQQRRENINKK